MAMAPRRWQLDVSRKRGLFSVNGVFSNQGDYSEIKIQLRASASQHTANHA
jgi:hypothetical protein